MEDALTRKLLSLVTITISVGVKGCPSSSGQVVSITLPADPNVNAQYACNVNGATLACADKAVFSASAQDVNIAGTAAATQCTHGFAKIWVETDNDGRVVRAQYQCAVAPVEEFPTDDEPDGGA